MQLNSKVTFGATQTLEFWPNGTVHVYNAANVAWPYVAPATPVNIILTSLGVNRSVTVNVLGKTQIQ